MTAITSLAELLVFSARRMPGYSLCSHEILVKIVLSAKLPCEIRLNTISFVKQAANYRTIVEAYP